MKVTTPEISWHNKDPVYSVDVQKKIVKTVGETIVYRIATGGTDCHVLVSSFIIHKKGRN
jgi:chromatin assembly factor 1 subunit B